MSELTMDTLVSLCKRRGFVYQSSEIYGGLASAWDYGPLGVELKENIKRQWWRTMVQQRDDMVGLDSSVILPRQVWVASGHVGVFTDPLTECLSCHKRFREDQMIEEFTERKGREPEGGLAEVACPNCGTRGKWTEPRDFNMMLKTFLGPIETEEGMHYLRPETAQGIFVNFANVVTTARKKPPFGIAQTGKSFRNEITPRNFTFRSREFEQMEQKERRIGIGEGARDNFAGGQIQVSTIWHFAVAPIESFWPERGNLQGRLANSMQEIASHTTHAMTMDVVAYCPRAFLISSQEGIRSLPARGTMSVAIRKSYCEVFFVTPMYIGRTAW